MKHPDGINIASNQSKCKRKRMKEYEKVFRWIEAGQDACGISGAGETVPADANPAAGREGPSRMAWSRSAGDRQFFVFFGTRD